MKVIAVHGRSGVTGETRVDDDDFDWLNQWRWHLSEGYVSRRDPLEPSKRVRMHRLILGLERGDPRQGDHIDLNPLNNQRRNLRIATHGQNQQNRRSRAGVSSRFRGVSWDKYTGRWRVRCQVEGRSHYLGSFSSEEEAGRVAAAWRLRNMPYSVDHHA